MSSKFTIYFFLAGADNITKISITNKSLDSVTVAWVQPEDPNGVIFTFTVEYQKMENKYVSYK